LFSVSLIQDVFLTVIGAVWSQWSNLAVWSDCQS